MVRSKLKRRPSDTEDGLIALLQRSLSSSKLPRRVLLGIGDDAALLASTPGKLVLSVDAAIEHVHFDRSWLTLRQLGARSLHAAASDLAAMGARPVSALCHLTLPRDFGRDRLRRLAKGQADAARELGCPVVGGNLSAGSELALVTTVVGSAMQPVTRAGARAGDELWLVGRLGLAAAGLELLKSRQREAGSGSAGQRCVQAWRSPRALVKRGLALAPRAHAVIDISDGLAVDAGRLAEASARRLVFDEAALRRALPPELKQVCRQHGWDALSVATAGGEDYALLAAGPPPRRPRWARAVGCVAPGAGAWIGAPGGQPHPLHGGYDHFAHLAKGGSKR